MESKVVVITAGTSVLGAALIKKFLSAGWRVHATTRSLHDKEEMMISHKDLVYHAADLEDPASITNLAQQLKSVGRGIDALVNNAGFVLSGPFENSTDEQIRRQMEVNFFGCISMIKQLLPFLKTTSQGTIVNISSLCGLLTLPMLSMYHASKWALEGFSESLWYELEPLGVRVKLIEPGGIKENNYTANVELVKEVSRDYECLLNRVHHSEWFPSFTQPGEVAEEIFKAATDPSNRLRYWVGEDCELLLNERADHLEGEQYLQKIKERISN